LETDRIRVLIVDDELRFGTNTAAVLNQRGFETTAVANGGEALREIVNVPFDVVVLDLSMPGMDGATTLREIKKLRPRMQIIMLTGFGTFASALDCLRTGAFDYLTKPCDLDMLAARIREAHEKGKTLPVSGG